MTTEQYTPEQAAELARKVLGDGMGIMLNKTTCLMGYEDLAAIITAALSQQAPAEDRPLEHLCDCPRPVDHCKDAPNCRIVARFSKSAEDMEQVQKDAERYQFLRDKHSSADEAGIGMIATEISFSSVIDAGDCKKYPDCIDRSIDAAIERAKREG